MTFDLGLYIQDHSAMTLQKLLKYGTSCCAHSTARTVLDGFFPYCAQMVTGIRLRGCVAHDGLWPWPVSFRSLSYNFATKLLKYDTPCPVRSTAYTVLDGYSPYLVQMITSIRGCVTCNDLSHWPLSSRSFIHVIKMLKRVHLVMSALKHIQFWMNSVHIWYKWSLAWEGM